MNQFVYFISGLIVGGLVVWFLAKPSASKVAEKEDLDELEKQGHIRQVGRTGKYVYYEKT